MGNCCANKVACDSVRVVYPSTTAHFDEAGQPVNPNANYAGNRISTTKYSIWTFLPLNLWEQFHRFANIYFVFILVLNFMPGIDAFAKEVAPIPVVLTLAAVAIKDAYEDFRRHLSDRRVNQRICEVFSVEKNCYVKEQWQHIQPGDFVRLHTNEMIPADVLLLHSSNVAGICHIETANLDGESNLKQRELLERRVSKVPFSPTRFTFPAEVEAPSSELYKFSGKIIRPDGFLPIRKNNMILRGCVLRNTDFVEGMVIYAGKETKAAMNNTGARFKRSKLERRINRDVIWCVLILAIICFTGAIGCGVWQQNLPGEDVLFVALDHNTSTSTPAFQGFLNFWRFIIIFQSIIPLPLYVSIEFIKMHQVWHMNNDLELYDPIVDKRIEVRAFNILEDLGQIEYVFCDKTGTLTENKMEFKRASIHGVDYWTEPITPLSDQNSDSVPNGLNSGNANEFTMSTPDSTPQISSLKSVIDRMSLLASNSPYTESQPEASNNNNNNNDTLVSSSSGDNMRAYVEDFILALAICNTAVVSATKNSASLFQLPTKRRGLRNLFRTNFGGSRGISSATSKLRRKVGSKTDGEPGAVKHAISLGSIFSRRARRSQLKKSELARSSRNDLPEATEETSSGDSVQPGMYDMLTMQTAHSVSSPGFSPSAAITSTSAATTAVTESTTTGGRVTAGTFPPNIPPSITLLEPDTASGQSVVEPAPLDGLQLSSTQSLPPVIQGLQLDLLTPRTLHGRRSRGSEVRWNILEQNADESDVNEEHVAIMNARPEPFESDLSSTMSLNSPAVGPTVHTSNRLYPDQDQGDGKSGSPSGAVPSTRTLTVVAHDGVSYDLPVSEDFVQATLDPTACPLSDQTLHDSYESESPDELSLVRAACRQGCKLIQRGVDFVLLWLPTDGLVAVRVLHILPFDSVRKRMSILIRHPATNEAVLYTKGADTAILDRVKCQNATEVELLERTRAHVDEYSRSGLRTLVIAKRVVPEDELNTWSREFIVAETTAGDSTKALGQLMDRIETDFTLLGATGIEDRLQQGVPQTIEHLREAGLHVWVLTGDKQETAVNIAHSARLITDEHKLIFINANSKDRTSYLLTCHLHAILCGTTWPPQEAITDVMSDGPDLTDSSSSEFTDLDEHVDQTDNMVTYVNTRRVRLCSPPTAVHPDCGDQPRRRRRRVMRCASESRIHTRSHGSDVVSNENGVIGDGSEHRPRRSRYRRRYHRRMRTSEVSHSRNHRRRLRAQLSRTRKTSLPADSQQLALIIDGETLEHALDDDNKANFLRLTQFCSSVLCCRSTPVQKAAVVSLVKDGLKVLTLAIGDGANDVNMIQVANVGVGISGQEGMQAVMASDFAISRFAFLERLVIVHGHICYDKLARTALYLFYKDAIYIFLLFWFQLFNGFSGSNAIDQLSQILFSITFTGLPSLLMGIWDNPIDMETLLANPVLYRAGIQGRAYRPWLFWISILDAVWQSLMIFFIPYMFYADSAMTLWRFGVLQTNILVICSLLHAALETRTWVLLHWVGLILSYLGLWVFFTMVYHALAVVGISPESPYRVIFVAMHDGPFWLLTLVTTTFALLPRLLFIAVKNTFNPSWDTIAGLLAKRYGPGKRLPLEPYIFGTRVMIPTGPDSSPSPDVKTESIRSTTPHVTPRGSMDNTSAVCGSRASYVPNVTDHVEPTEQAVQFISRMGQLFTISGRLLRGVPPSSSSPSYEDSRTGTNVRMLMRSTTNTSPLSMINLRPGQSHTAIDLRRRRRRTQTLHNPRHHLHHLDRFRASNNFDDDTGRPMNPVIWPAVDPNVRARSLSTRRYSISRVHPNVFEIRPHIPASSLSLNRAAHTARAFPGDPYASSDCPSPPPAWVANVFDQPNWPIGLDNPPPPYSLEDLPNPQERYHPPDPVSNRDTRGPNQSSSAPSDPANSAR